MDVAHELETARNEYGVPQGICLTPEQRAELAAKYPSEPEPSAPRPVLRLVPQMPQAPRYNTPTGTALKLVADYEAGLPLQELVAKYGANAVATARRWGGRRKYSRRGEKLDTVIAWLLAWPKVPDTQLAKLSTYSRSYINLVRRQLGIPPSTVLT